MSSQVSGPLNRLVRNSLSLATWPLKATASGVGCSMELGATTPDDKDARALCRAPPNLGRLALGAGCPSPAGGSS
eukprot:7672162-Lingulodinium_polyedra.AAC.1